MVSSDLCHWGNKYSFTPYKNLTPEPEDSDEDEVFTPIWEFIKALDMSGIDAIRHHDTPAFYHYCEQIESTICGRHAIGVLLAAIQNLGHLK